VQCVKGLGLNKTKIRRQNNKSKNLDVFFKLKLLVEMPCKFFPFVRHTKFGDFFPLHIIQNELHLHLTHRSKGKGDSNHVKKRRVGERMVREEWRRVEERRGEERRGEEKRGGERRRGGRSEGRRRGEENR
jgi:hypothetical protein